ncbi:MAG TPA: hypothetical protein VMI31_18565 [Fimbriimonadaceae bacterium]|nr:hypothetical protein [Fimbriimonadaceae bacterium]
MLIMSQCHGNVDESNLEFIQVHALAIVQLCNQLMDSPLSTASYGANLASG